MPRVRRGFKARRRRNKILKFARGFYGARSRQYASAVEQVHNAWDDAYKHRKAKKRDFRRLWIARIGAAARGFGVSYSKLISGLKHAGVELDRKMLSEIAVVDPGGFRAIVDEAKKQG